MMGLEGDRGVNYKALKDLFDQSQGRRDSITYDFSVQMVEIYNDQVRDLLTEKKQQQNLRIMTSPQRSGSSVPDASTHPVKSLENVMELMRFGSGNRAVSATALNASSSRSHSVLSVYVRGTDLKTNTVLDGNLDLIDLAGSERVKRSLVAGDMLRETNSINTSLAALGQVIHALARKHSHVPYRNCKLTELLQRSLGGQAKTVMFVHLNSDLESYPETISTLNFAQRVSGVELGAAQSNKEGKGVASMKDKVAKKDEEISHLLAKTNLSAEKHGLSLPRYGSSSSARRHPVGDPPAEILAEKPSVSARPPKHGQKPAQEFSHMSSIRSSSKVLPSSKTTFSTFHA